MCYDCCWTVGSFLLIFWLLVAYYFCTFGLVSRGYWSVKTLACDGVVILYAFDLVEGVFPFLIVSGDWWNWTLLEDLWRKNCFFFNWLFDYFSELNHEFDGSFFREFWVLGKLYKNTQFGSCIWTFLDLSGHKLDERMVSINVRDSFEEEEVFIQPTIV